MKFLSLRCFILSLLMAFQAVGSDQVCPTPLPTQYQDVQPGKVVSAYFGSWDVYGTNNYQIDRVEEVADKLTHLVYGFMKPDETDASCKPHDVWADVGAYDDVQTKVGGNFAKLIDLKAKFPHLKILLSVGGGKYNKNFIAIAQDKDKLLKFAQSCVNRLDFYDHPYLLEGKYKRLNHLNYEGLFDGIDLDWEWDGNSLTPELSQAYTEFVQELKRLLVIREQSMERKYLLTVALQVVPKIYKNLDLMEVAKSTDLFHVMAYDFFGPNNTNIGFNAPICGKWSVYSIDGALQRIMEQGISPEKMVLGLPLYGYLYENTDGHNALIDKNNKIKTIAYHVIKTKFLDNPSYAKKWNDYEKVPSLYSQSDKTFISYDGKDSLAAKVEFAKKKKLQGVVLWRLSGDDAQHSMVDMIARNMTN